MKKLHELAAKLEKSAVDYGLYVDEIVYNTLDEEERTKLEKYYQVPFLDSITLVSTYNNIEVLSNGIVYLIDRETETAKEYKRIASAVRAASRA